MLIGMSMKDHKYIKLTAERMKALHSERKRTAVGSHALLNNAAPKHDLSPSIIERWLYGQRLARKDQYDHVLKLYAVLPTYLELTEFRVNSILAEKKRTVLGSAALLKKAKDIPAGLTAAKIDLWVTGARHAKEEHYAYVLDQYELHRTNIECEDDISIPALPPADPDYRWLKRGRNQDQLVPAPVQRSKRGRFVKITEDMRNHLNAEFERTGVSIPSLVRARPEWASNTRYVKVLNWLSGRTKKARKPEWDYIAQALSSLPDRRN